VLLHCLACEDLNGRSQETDRVLTVFESRKLYKRIQAAHAAVIEQPTAASRAIYVIGVINYNGYSIKLAYIQV
jgi:hypothetical protein